MTTPNIDLGKFGVFTLGGIFFEGVTPEQAQEIERLGYGTLWVSGSPPAELSFAEPLLEATTSLKVATGVVNIWSAPAKTVAESFHRINTAYPRRFVLGIGAGHPEHTLDTASPSMRWSTTSTSSTNTAYRPIDVWSRRSARMC